jgi:hypothetical protein
LVKERNASKLETQTNKGNDEEEVDSLDAFMMGIQQQLIAQSTQHSEGPKVAMDFYPFTEASLL